MAKQACHGRGKVPDCEHVHDFPHYHCTYGQRDPGVGVALRTYDDPNEDAKVYEAPYWCPLNDAA